MQTEEPHTCVYCGQPATHQFKNGKWCCQESRNLCPEMRRIRSEKSKIACQKFKEKYGNARAGWRGHTIGRNPDHLTKYPSRGDHICVYCGGHADYQLKDGRWCCQPSSNSCSVRRTQNSKSHQIGSGSEGVRRAYESRRGKPTWNKGKTYQDFLESGQYDVATIQRWRAVCRENGKRSQAIRQNQSEEIKAVIRKKLSEKAKLLHYGGYKPGSGFGKRGWIRGYRCDSTYELVFVLYNTDHHIQFDRCQIIYEYVFEGKTHKYHPDFILEDGSLVEIKGYPSELTDAKLAAVKDRPITLMYREDMNYMFDWVKQHYQYRKLEDLYDRQIGKR